MWVLEVSSGLFIQSTSFSVIEESFSSMLDYCRSSLASVAKSICLGYLRTLPGGTEYED